MDENHRGFPFEREKLGIWCGPIENCGHTMTYWILTDDTEELIAHSSVRLVRRTDDNGRQAPVNLRLLLDTHDEAEGVKRDVKYEFEK